MHEVVNEHRIKTSYLVLNVNPMFLMGRSYTDQEVVGIIRGLGHVVVPEECWTTCCNLPVNTVLTGNDSAHDKPLNPITSTLVKVSKLPPIDGIHINVVGASNKPLNAET